ncbi:hypothetical protein F2Q69_00050916 [Brassica cretica]|uniref:Uncharacterized protein n=1 Tax=Brassica cretica TaxID=69181 RepID=A0A8S9PGX6_BRACR|nr:hypothetical protein F2Q69_00050916 [Brassica cretica]
MRAGWSRVTSLSNLLLIPPFPFPCAQDWDRAVTIAVQLVTACPVGMLLKGEVLGSKLTSNLIMELKRTHNGGVGIGALQCCEPGTHGAGNSHGAGCHIGACALIDEGPGVEDGPFALTGGSGGWATSSSVKTGSGASTGG